MNWTYCETEKELEDLVSAHRESRRTDYRDVKWLGPGKYSVEREERSFRRGATDYWSVSVPIKDRIAQLKADLFDVLREDSGDEEEVCEDDINRMLEVVDKSKWKLGLSEDFLEELRRAVKNLYL